MRCRLFSPIICLPCLNVSRMCLYVRAHGACTFWRVWLSMCVSVPACVSACLWACRCVCFCLRNVRYVHACLYMWWLVCVSLCNCLFPCLYLQTVFIHLFAFARMFVRFACSCVSICKCVSVYVHSPVCLCAWVSNCTGVVRVCCVFFFNLCACSWLWPSTLEPYCSVFPRSFSILFLAAFLRYLF